MFLVCVALQPERVQAQISTPPVVQVAGFAVCLNLKLCPGAAIVLLLTTAPQRIHLRISEPLVVQVGFFSLVQFPGL